MLGRHVVFVLSREHESGYPRVSHLNLVTFFNTLKTNDIPEWWCGR